MKKSCIRYYGGKLLAFVVSVLVLSVLVFYIARLAPGDPLVSYYGDRVEKMSVAERAWAEEKLGLSDPIYVQYVRWLAGALHAEFGISYKYKMDVLEVIGSRVGNTLILGGIGFVLIFTLAMALGVQLIGPHFAEQKIYRAGLALEQAVGTYDEIAAQGGDR